MDWEKGARGGHLLALPGLPKPTWEGKRRWVGMNSLGAALGAPGGRCLYETLCTFSLYVLLCLCLFPSHCQCSREGTEDRGSGSPATAGRSPPDQCEPLSLSSLYTANLSSYPALPLGHRSVPITMHGLLLRLPLPHGLGQG